jgi:RNA polymerase sigma factor (sigma-70 family)
VDFLIRKSPYSGLKKHSSLLKTDVKHLPPNYTEERLVRELKQRCSRAFSLLYDHYSEALLGVITQVVKDKQLAQDIFQDSFIKVYHKIDLFDAERGRLFTWLINIARHTAFDHIRKNRNVVEMQFNEFSLQIVDKKHQVLQTNTDSIGLTELIYVLPKDTVSIFELIYFGGYTHIEVAETLGIPLGTVKTKVRKGLEDLRKLA